MSHAPHDGSQHRRPHAPPTAAPFLEFDLVRELEQLHGEPERSSGQNARTLVKYADFRVVLTALTAAHGFPGLRQRGGSRSRPSLAISWCERKIGRSIYLLEPCSHWTRACLMTLRRLKRAPSSSRLRGLVRRRAAAEVEHARAPTPRQTTRAAIPITLSTTC